MKLQITNKEAFSNNVVELRDVEFFNVNAAEITIFFSNDTTYTEEEFIRLIEEFGCLANYHFNESPFGIDCLLGIGVDNMKKLTFNII